MPESATRAGAGLFVSNTKVAVPLRGVSIADPALIEEAVAVGGRRTKKEAVTEALKEYIARRRQAGIIRELAVFPDEPLETADFERAAEHFNTCRGQAVHGSNTDFLICASGERRQLPILTTDADFSRYAGILSIVLYGASQRQA